MLRQVPVEFVSAAAASVFGAAPATLRSLHGGDLSEVFLLIFADGRRVVGKTGRMVDREARMLAAIRAAGAVAPEVLAVQEGVMFLEVVSDIAPDTAWQALGTTLRRLHAATGPQFGWNESYAFGEVAIPNRYNDNWVEFWAEQRLMAAPNALEPELAHRVERLCARLGDLVPAHPRRSLLHGDLWVGNVVFGEGGSACLIDPACYYGHNEVDLAMLHLFGAPGPGFAAAYGALEPGWRERRAIYQLWPALVHLQLFGSGYRSLVESRLSAVGA